MDSSEESPALAISAAKVQAGKMRRMARDPFLFLVWASLGVLILAQFAFAVWMIK
ncbi:MAG: hypothetical protein JW942_09070 [Opitutales bacterium]|nr:hypothetical protein [Opitutales bacterium]